MAYQKPKKPKRIYVKVSSDFDSTGYMQPRSITWSDGHVFRIDAIRDFYPAGAGNLWQSSKKSAVPTRLEPAFAIICNDEIESRIDGMWKFGGIPDFPFAQNSLHL